MGENARFTTGFHYLSIHATNSSGISSTLYKSIFNSNDKKNLGHALVSVGTTNNMFDTTFSMWQGSRENDIENLGNKDYGSQNNSGRNNNIATNSDVRIDSNFDRAVSAFESGYEGWKRKTYAIPKTSYDTIKYMRGWRTSWNFENYSLTNATCAIYSKSLWNEYIIYAPNGGYWKQIGGQNYLPVHIYNSISSM